MQKKKEKENLIIFSKPPRAPTSTKVCARIKSGHALPRGIDSPNEDSTRKEPPTA